MKQMRNTEKSKNIHGIITGKQPPGAYLMHAKIKASARRLHPLAKNHPTSTPPKHRALRQTHTDTHTHTWEGVEGGGRDRERERELVYIRHYRRAFVLGVAIEKLYCSGIAIATSISIYNLRNTP